MCVCAQEAHVLNGCHSYKGIPLGVWREECHRKRLRSQTSIRHQNLWVTFRFIHVLDSSGLFWKKKKNMSNAGILNIYIYMYFKVTKRQQQKPHIKAFLLLLTHIDTFVLHWQLHMCVGWKLRKEKDQQFELGPVSKAVKKKFIWIYSNNILKNCLAASVSQMEADCFSSPFCHW